MPPRQVTDLGGVVLCFLLHARNVQYVICGFLSLGGGDHYDALLAAEFGEPALNIGGLILEDGRRNSPLRRTDKRPTIRDQLPQTNTWPSQKARPR